jgi:hypothetical protein
VVLGTEPNWTDIVLAISTAVGALGLLSAIGAVIFAAQQVREARQTRQAGMAADFLRRWDEPALVATRRFIGEFESPEALSVAFQRFIATNSANAFILYQELDYFEQLSALEQVGAFDFGLIELLLGRRLIDRWDMWKPSLDAMGGDPYPHFRKLVERMRAALDTAPGADQAVKR